MPDVPDMPDVPGMPTSHDELGQAAEYGHWFELECAIYRVQPLVDLNTISVEQESRVITAAVLQDQWLFLQEYATHGHVRHCKNFRAIMAAAVQTGYFFSHVLPTDLYKFASTIMVTYWRRYIYDLPWLVYMMGMFLRNDLHLPEALQVARMLPCGIPRLDLRGFIATVEAMPTDKTEEKTNLLQHLRSL
ncbi:hypothetical protein ACOMHN_012480 [Nucella lapillus]